MGIREDAGGGRGGHLAIAATAWFGRDLSQLAAQPVVFGLAYLAFAIAVAIRFGAIPFHLWAARLADAAPETTLPILTALAPAAFAPWSPWPGSTPRSRRLAGPRPGAATIVLADRHRIHRAGGVRGVRPGRPGARGRLLDRRRRGRRHPRPGGASTPAAWAPARIWVLACRGRERVRRLGGRHPHRVLDRADPRPARLGHPRPDPGRGPRGW